MSDRSWRWRSSWVYGILLLASACVGVGASTSVPSAPTGPSAVPGNAQATVSWTAPANNGSSIAGYVITPYVGTSALAARPYGAAATSEIVTGLTNATTYTFKVAATNANGTGPQSVPTTAVTVGAPVKPTGPSAVLGNAQATVSWTAPANNGSSIAGYVITPYVGTSALAARPYGAAATEIVTGLTNATTYTFKVAATNANGTGPQSVPTNAITVGAPIAPTRVSAVLGDRQVTVIWTAPADNGSPITGYVITPYVAGIAQTLSRFGSTGTVQIVSGLTNATTYTFKVAATNSNGIGPKSASSNAVTPKTLPGTWQVRASASFARQEVSYVYAPVTGKFYLAGGRSTVQEAYDPRADSWTTVAPLPAALDHIQGVELNGLIYYIGGLVKWPSPASGTVYIYDPNRDLVSTGASMPAGRERGAGGVAVYNGKIYYAGGLHNGVAVSWFDEYDPVADTWSTLSSMPEARDHFQAAVVGDRFYAIGGRNSSINATTTVNDAFDMTTRAWVTGFAPLPIPRGGFAAAALGSEILIIGGEGAGHAYSAVEAYDTTANSWTELAAMPTGRHGIEAAVCNGGAYIADGGTRQAGGAPTSVQEAFFRNTVTTCGT